MEEKNFTLIENKTKEDIEILKEDWAITAEGLAKESFEDFLDWADHFAKLKKRELYLTPGKVMNEAYGLTGNNRYPENLNIVSIKLEDMENPNALALPKMMTGARWMYDIVENNLARERRA